MITGTLTVRGWIAAALLVFLPASLDAAAEQRPRVLSAAEAAAVALAVDYLHHGPEAWWDRLADDAPLRQLGQETAVAALEVRAGPPSGAHWQLQTVTKDASADTAVFTLELPSGVEETLHLGLEQDGERWQIQTVRMSSEPLQSFGVSATGVADAPEEEPVDSAASRSKTLPSILGAIAVLSLILAIRRGIWLAIVGVVFGAAALGLLFLNPFGQTEPASGSAVAASDPDSEAELAGLLELRRAMATADPAALETARASVPKGSNAARVAQLWEAQLALSKHDLNAVDAALAAFPAPAAMPQAERLRARLGFLRRSELDTAQAYERLLEMGAWDDALLFEAAQAFELLGFPARAQRYYDELAAMGSRDADFYYSRASAAIYDNLGTKAEREFQKGWGLKPMTRDAVMGNVFLGFLVGDVKPLKVLLDLDSPNEPVVGCNRVSSQPLTLPEGAQARLVGGFLSLELGNNHLEVPRGCQLAPEGVEVLDAGRWRQHRESSMLAALPNLVATVRSKGAFSRPRVRQEVEEAVEALVRLGRWDEVLEVTDGLTTEIAGIPPSVVRQRAEALRRAGRRKSAVELLVALVASNAKNRQVDPGALYQLANLLVTDRQYDLALKLIAKADAQMPFEIDPRRQRQVQMERRLVDASAVYESDHFEIFYPFERPLHFADRFAEIMEAERKRLQKWIPVSKSSKTEVLILGLDDFMTGYGGAEGVVGVFDGKIRVPFARVNTFTPLVVSILTHELAHAMMTEATQDRAPHWFQEGLAQHVEMPQQGINPIAGYRSTGNLLSLPMVESVLDGYAAPHFVPVAYDESRWVLHYVEKRYGIAKIHRLLDAFRDGLTTEGAVSKVLGKTVAELDHDTWEWCTTKAPEMWPSEITHYDTYEGPVLLPEHINEIDSDSDEEDERRRRNR